MTINAEISTQYNFSQPLGEQIRDIDIKVPFALDEIENLKKLREMSSSWNDMVPPGSGLVRELNCGLVSIPWAYGLRDKDRALGIMRETIENIRMVREKYPTNSEYLLVNDDLSTIESSLLQFVPDMIVPD